MSKGFNNSSMKIILVLLAAFAGQACSQRNSFSSKGEAEVNIDNSSGKQLRAGFANGSVHVGLASPLPSEQTECAVYHNLVDFNDALKQLLSDMLGLAAVGVHCFIHRDLPALAPKRGGRFSANAARPSA